MKYNTPTIYFALPVMDEFQNLPQLLNSLIRQKNPYPSKLVVCVNQPETYWFDKDKLHICENNRQSIQLLQSFSGIEIHCIDKSSKGNGWVGKKHGVGFARKMVMDFIASEADTNDFMFSIDADTVYPENYVASAVAMFQRYPDALALANPYYHRLTGDEITDRAILRYELYMRNYAINMMKIGNPYAFTAVGSSMVNPVWAYTKIGGITPKLSGEDFYFIQKLKKNGKIIIYNRERSYPAARFSNRVFFGTGPAMIKGREGDWSSYPIYPQKLFQLVADSYAAFPDLYENNPDYPMKPFLETVFSSNWYEPLRKNNKSRERFVKACKDKIDGLRILQFLKSRYDGCVNFENENIVSLIRDSQVEGIQKYRKCVNYNSFSELSIEDLNTVRDTLAHIEMEMLLKNQILN